MRESLDTGREGEETAALFLRNKGYSIIETNFKCRAGEIDIIALDGEYLVFAEVKYRKNNLYGSGLEQIDIRKQKKIIKCAEYYLVSHPGDYQPRFDAIEISPDGIVHLEDAFDYGSIYYR